MLPVVTINVIKIGINEFMNPTFFNDTATTEIYTV